MINIEEKKNIGVFLEKSLALLNQEYKFSTIVGLNFQFMLKENFKLRHKITKLNLSHYIKESLIFQVN